MENPIRILQVVTHMNRGGLESMIMNYYRRMDRTKVQFDFLTHRPESEKKDFDDEIRELGGKIYHLPILNPFSRSYKKALNQFFKDHPEYCVIHVHQDCLSSVILKVARKNGVKVRIAHCHSSHQDKNLKYIIKLFYRHFIKHEATKLYACGDVAGKWMFCTDRFEVLPNAIDAAKYRYDSEKREKFRARYGIGSDTYVLGHVARFSEVKNHSFLIDVFYQMRKKMNIDSKLVLVGAGELMDAMRKKVQELDLEKDVIFMGLRSDVPDVMQMFDLFCLPSIYEGLPVTMVEAQAAGLPCIISDGVPRDCIMTDSVEVKALADGVESWADTICKMPRTRKDNYQLIVDQHFDIAENAAMLQNRYLEWWRAAQE